jgi:putative serine protease PepD
VIGINSQIAAGNGQGSVGIGFAVPIDTAEEFLPRLERGGQVTLAFLGVSQDPSPPARTGGVAVDVAPGGPAASAGLRDHDTIKAIAGHRVRTIGQLQTVVESRMPGVSVAVDIRRAGKVRRLKVVLGARPQTAPGS